MKDILTKLETRITNVERELATLPEGYLTKKRSYFYHVIGQKSTGITSAPEMIKKLCRKKQLLTEKRKLLSDIDILKQAMKKMETTDAVEVKDFSKTYQGLPKSYFYHSQITHWLNSPSQKNPYPIKESYFSNSGTEFRSKSEVLIANQLEKHEIPYKNDVALTLSGQTKYPDFIIKNPYTNKTIIWEHFGALDKQDYEDSMDKKMGLYMKNGLKPWDNLIYTFEFDIKNPYRIEQLIQDFILKV